MSIDSTGQYTIPVRSFVCSVGANIEDTPTGVYTTSDYYEWRINIILEAIQIVIE